MTGLSVAVLLQAALMASESEDYAEAHKNVTETGRPMVIMVGADWCPACEVMKQSVIPQVKQHGVLRKVAYAVVNLDRERELGRQLTGGGPIPQLIMYRKTSDGWLRKKLVGSQSPETVEAFINEAVDLDDNAKKVQPVSQERKTPDTAAEHSAATEGRDDTARRG